MRPELEVQFWIDGYRVEQGVHLTEAQLSALMWALYDYRHEPKRGVRVRTCGKVQKSDRPA